MSYSRWTHSVWYTYWTTESGATRDEQLLCVDGGAAGPVHVSFATICKDKDAALRQGIDARPGANLAELAELWGYMLAFREEVARQNFQNSPPREEIMAQLGYEDS